MHRSRGLVLVLFLASLAAAGAFLANLALADLATRRDDPVGRLTPVVPGATSSVTVPTTTTGEPIQTTPTTDGDSAGGEGRDHDEDD